MSLTAPQPSADGEVGCGQGHTVAAEGLAGVVVVHQAVDEVLLLIDGTRPWIGPAIPGRAIHAYRVQARRQHANAINRFCFRQLRNCYTMDVWAGSGRSLHRPAKADPDWRNSRAWAPRSTTDPDTFPPAEVARDTRVRAAEHHACVPRRQAVWYGLVAAGG